MSKLFAIFLGFSFSTVSFGEDAFEGYFPTAKIGESRETHNVSRIVEAGTPELVLERIAYEINWFAHEDLDADENIVGTVFDPLNSDNLYIRLEASLIKQAPERQTLWTVQFDRHNIATTALHIPLRGTFAFLGMSSGEVHVIDTANGHITRTLTAACKGPCLAIELSRDEQILAVGDANGNISLLQAATGQVLSQWKAHDYPVRAIRIAQGPNGNFLLSHDWFELAVRNLDDQADLRRIGNVTINGQKDIWIDTFDLIRSNSYALIASGLNAKIIDFRNGQTVRQFGPTNDSILSLQVSDDESKLIGFSFDQLVYTWDLDSLSVLARGYARAPLFSNFVNVAISQDGKQMALSSLDPELAFPPRLFHRVRVYKTPGN